MASKLEKIPTRIWQDYPSPSNPFTADSSFCYGYDVYEDLLPNIRWIEYLFLLFKGEAPSVKQAQLLEKLAIAVAHPGLRDHSVRAAMTSGTGGSGNAASLMAALGVGAGNLGGAREIYHAVILWQQCGQAIEQWKSYLETAPADEREDVWTPMEHVPGFDPNGKDCPRPVLLTLQELIPHETGSSLTWLSSNHQALESTFQYPLAFSGVAAAALFDLGFDENQAEMLYLILRLPGAAVQAIERQSYGWRHYPFFGDKLHLKDKNV